MTIRPQPGPQQTFLASPADIAIYGGGAGGGKTWALLLEPLRHIGNPEFSAVVLRRNLVQVTNPGGLWDEAAKLYGVIPGAKSISQPLQWSFQSGAKVRFGHLQDEKTVYDWQGSQVPLFLFDELTHFSKSQFFYMLSRNRSMCGVQPYIRATCNPDADSWVAEFIAWWIDQNTGLPITERAGVLRWFVRVGDVILWADSPEELPEQRTPDGQVIPPKSVTFIPAKLTDNAALMAADPGYYGNLLAMPTVERERLLGGNWKIRPAAGLYFQRLWCEMVDAVPAGLEIVRGWDLAATEKTEQNDPDFTANVKLGRASDGTFYILHADQFQKSPQKVEEALKNTASQDGKGVKISAPQDPGQAGKAQALNIAKLLAGYDIRLSTESRGKRGDPAKITRFSPFSAQAQAGNVKVLRGQWNEMWFDCLEGFPDAAHDDLVDATSRAFNELLNNDGMGVLNFYANLSAEAAKASKEQQ